VNYGVIKQKGLQENLQAFEFLGWLMGLEPNFAKNLLKPAPEQPRVSRRQFSLS
jgi:hypothetical protein